MALPDHLQALLDPASYPHPCPRIELIETHISWVVLTGAFAYKIKKPLKLEFLDFSTLEFLGSGGGGNLLHLQKHLAEHDIALRLAGLADLHARLRAAVAAATGQPLG